MPDVATLELAGAVAGSLAPTVTLHDVELVETGVHAGSTGPTPVERADLESMIAAAADPEVDRASVHPGHFDPRFVQALADGEPAIGWAIPRRIVDVGGKSKLIGDLVDVPAKLAAIIPKAYARRSVEFSPKVTPSGRAYRAALNGLALLGVAIPAVKGLADIVNRYSAGPPLTVGPQVFLSDTPSPDAPFHVAWWSSGHDGGRADLLSMEGGALMPRFDNARYQALLAEESTRHAQAMAGLLSQAAVADPTAPPLPGYPGMPAPAAPAAPAAPPAAPQAPAGWAFDAAGQIVPAAPAAPAAPAPAPVPGWPPAAPAPAAVWPPAPAAQPVAPAPNPYAPVAPAPVPGWPATAAVPPAHPAMPGLPPVAPAQPAPAAPQVPAGWPAGYAPPAAAPAGSPFAPAPAAPAAPTPGAIDPATGLVATLSAGQLSELQARAARGDQAMQALEAQQREHYLSAAVAEGRISIAERAAWAAQMAAPGAMATTVALLSSLTPGRVPVTPLGQAALAAGNTPVTGGVPDAAWDAWEAETFGIAPPAAPAAPAAPVFAAPAPIGV